MIIRKAVFPAAGMGTRFLPATKAIPKEMLPLVDKPLIQYSVEEAKTSGIKEIIIVTGRGKSAIEDHFDSSFELEYMLKKKKNAAALDAIRSIGRNIHYSYTRQVRPLGLGHAILCAKNLVGREPFAVFLGDDIIDSKVPLMGEMLRVFKKYSSTVLAVEEVPKKDTRMYGIIKGRKVEDAVYKVEDLVEKPDKNPPSNLAIIGRYVLTPLIFDFLEKAKPGKGKEIQLTDAIKELLKKEDVYAFKFKGSRYDAGDKLGYLKANISLGLKRKEMRGELKKFIKGLV